MLRLQEYITADALPPLHPPPAARRLPTAASAGAIRVLSPAEKSKYFVEYAPTLYDAIAKAKLEFTLRAIQAGILLPYILQQRSAVGAGAGISSSLQAHTCNHAGVFCRRCAVLQAVEMVHHFSNPLLAVTFLALDGEPDAASLSCRSGHINRLSALNHGLLRELASSEHDSSAAPTLASNCS
jgi:hypothetical protein